MSWIAEDDKSKWQIGDRLVCEDAVAHIEDQDMIQEYCPKAWKNVDAMERTIIEMLEKLTGE